MVLAILYIVATGFGMVLVSGAIGNYCAARGIAGTEAQAKLWAIGMRASEVVIAALLLFILNGPILHGPPSGFIKVLAGLYALVVVGFYIIGSAFALVTVPFGNQRRYFIERMSRLNDNDGPMR